MKRNILADWRAKYDLLSSLIYQGKECMRIGKGANSYLMQPYLRRDVDRIANVLTGYFGKDFFIFPINKMESIENTNWILSLFAQLDHSSILALFEVCDLITYLDTLDNAIQDQFKRNTNNIARFQDLFFELYTFKVLEHNGIKVKKKVMQDEKELDGMCVINGKEFLFECKKLYSIKRDELDTIKHITELFYLTTNKLKIGIEMVGYIMIKGDAKKAKNKISEMLVGYLKSFVNDPTQGVTLNLEDEFMSVHIEPYVHGKYEKIKEKLKSPGVSFMVSANPINPYHFQFEILGYYTQVDSAIMKKLVGIAKEKRGQHKNSENENRIFFFDNEIQKSWKFALLPKGQSTIDKVINDYVNSKETKDIICIFNRDFISDPPTVEIKVYSKEEFSDIKAVLENLGTNFSHSRIRR